MDDKLIAEAAEALGKLAQLGRMIEGASKAAEMMAGFAQNRRELETAIASARAEYEAAKAEAVKARAAADEAKAQGDAELRAAKQKAAGVVAADGETRTFAGLIYCRAGEVAVFVGVE